MGKIRIKKIVAVASSVALLGATLGAVSAQTFSDYPNFLFDSDGVFNAQIVIGDDAHASDVVGSIEVATALQSEAVQTLPEKNPANVETVFSGTAVEFSKGNDLLELYEPLGDVREVITDRDLELLQGGVISTQEGTTNFDQYLRFAESGTLPFNSSLSVVYGKDEDDNLGDFLYAKSSSDNYMFEYEISFGEGVESEISNTDLTDLNDEIFNILGTPFAVADTDITTSSNTLRISFLGGAVSDILEEGQTKVYTIEGKEYEVNALIVSDTKEAAKFEINGEVTDLLEDGESDLLKDGIRLGIREILPNEAEEVSGGDLVEFYLGATKIDLTDNYADTSFSQGIEVDDENIEDGVVRIKGRTVGSNNFEITSIKYRLEADAIQGDMYIPPGGKLSEYLDEPEGMISPNWDILYGGLMDTGVSLMRFAPSGDDKYRLHFTNNEDLNYKIDLLDLSGGNIMFGDDDNNLIWIESTNETTYNIAEDDFLILTDDNDETGRTHVLSYEGYDTGDQMVVFVDLFGESRDFTVQNGRADIVVGGNSFTAYVGPSPSYSLAVDLNNDGVVGDGDDTANDACTKNIVGFSINSSGGYLDATDKVTSSDPVGPCRSTIVIQGGGVLDLGVVDGASNPVSGTLAMGLKTLNSEFDENGPRDLGGDEVIAFAFSKSGSELRLTLDESNSNSRLNLEQDKESDWDKAMSDYGVLIEYDDDGSDAQELIVEYPFLQRGANVFLVSAQAEIQEAASFVPVSYNKIEVGAAKLASEVNSIKLQNTILIGGPCANKWSAMMLGFPQPCHKGFEKNTGYLKILPQSSGQVAVLIAGYEAQDTRKAARALAEYRKHNLQGSDIEISGSLDRLIVNKVS